MKILILLLLCFAVVGCDLEDLSDDSNGGVSEDYIVGKDDPRNFISYSFVLNGWKDGGIDEDLTAMAIKVFPEHWESEGYKIFLRATDYGIREAQRQGAVIINWETFEFENEPKLVSYYTEVSSGAIPVFYDLKEESNDLIYENNFHDSSDFTARELAIQESDKSGKPAVDEDGFVFYYPNPVTERQRNVNELSPERMEQLKRSLGY